MDYVDLGLPSQLKWAKCNIGANTEEEAGLYFQWGDTQGYTVEQIGKEKQFSIDFSDYLPKHIKYDVNIKEKNLPLKNDAAYILLGNNWKIPSKRDFIELCLNTNIYLVLQDNTEIKGVIEKHKDTISIEWDDYLTITKIKGIKFYKKGDKNIYLFIPCVGNLVDSCALGNMIYGDVWSSTLYEDVEYAMAWNLSIYKTCGEIEITPIYEGLPIRAITK